MLGLSSVFYYLDKQTQSIQENLMEIFLIKKKNKFYAIPSSVLFGVGTLLVLWYICYSLVFDFARKCVQKVKHRQEWTAASVLWWRSPVSVVSLLQDCRCCLVLCLLLFRSLSRAGRRGVGAGWLHRWRINYNKTKVRQAIPCLSYARP